MHQDDQDAGAKEEQRAEIFLHQDIEIGQMGQSQRDQVLEEHSVLAVLIPQATKRQMSRVRLLNQFDVEPLIGSKHVDPIGRDTPDVEGRRCCEDGQGKPGETCICLEPRIESSMVLRDPTADADLGRREVGSAFMSSWVGVLPSRGEFLTAVKPLKPGKLNSPTPSSDRLPAIPQRRAGSQRSLLEWSYACCRQRSNAKVRPPVIAVQKHHQDQRIDWRFPRIRSGCRSSWLRILGVDEQDPDSDGLGHLEGLEYEVFQQYCSDSLTLVS